MVRKVEMFYLGGISSVLLEFFLLSPNTPAPAKGKPINLRDLLMLDAFGLLKNPAFAVLCSVRC